MKYVIQGYGALCELQTFVINGVNADYEDFGEKYDDGPANAEDYACGDMTFYPKPATDVTLSKYKISADEYNTITEELRDKLSFGNCGWCV